jgi:hypothetical protein
MNKLTEIQKAYIAGFIDGEGCITVVKNKKILSRHGFSFQVRIIITNSNLEVLETIKNYIGIGSLRENLKWCGYKKNWKPIHRLEISSLKGKDLLREILPYLIVKREIAKNVINFPSRLGGKERTNDEFEKQSNALLIIRELNKRGLSFE